MKTIAKIMQSYVDIKALNDLNGPYQTATPGVKFYRASSSSEREPLLYQSGIIVMGQGRKNIYIADNCVQYGPGDYLALGVPMPLECEAFSDNGLPILGLIIDVEPHTLHKLVSQIDEQDKVHKMVSHSDKLCFGVKSSSLNEQFNNAIIRLINVLHNDVEAKILGPAIVEEIVYRALVGADGHILFDLARHDGHYARIARVLDTLHKEYADVISIEHLAEQAHMSVSGFHRAFRQVTSETPLQYLKKIRLNKAKELIVADGKQATEAAMLVGYASPSQFSREFKRHFNATPKTIAI
ncbi:AraC family transcriptional regulator [Colwellia sp. Arc7-635]|uniref:AraC family transcriptional regulator n=1 Tax=Colwellia sp. Arc7-635 TaxID=2497879 RepID=UPI000F85740D|nr:AraC family transcriptional regulator [Colwellia sp. Arc7-635]AZQ82712.1 AraC family transcriptional regulator [Colwellia sp. Arc7-635]